jgi:hypothetical protein
VRELRERNTSSNDVVLDDESVLSSVKSTPLDFHHPVVAFSSVLLSCVKNKDNIDSSINRVDAHTDFGAATLGTAISNINNPTVVDC